MSPEKIVLTYAEVGKVLGVSVDTVRRLVAAGEIRVVRWHHRLVRVPVRTLHEDIERMTGSASELSPSMTAQPPRAAVDGECSAARPAGRGTTSMTPHVVEENTPTGDDVGLTAEAHRIAS